MFDEESKTFEALKRTQMVTVSWLLKICPSKYDIDHETQLGCS
jgi:hypothetical protein